LKYVKYGREKMTESRIKKYKRYKKRIANLETEIELYEFSLQNRGEIFWAKEVVKRFGYENNLHYGGYPSLVSSRLGKYIRLLPYKKGQKRFLQVKDVIWLPKEKVNEAINKKRLNMFNSGQTASNGFIWVEREKVPFWMLEEYGGRNGSEDFINRLKLEIKSTEDKIKTLKLGEKWT